MRIVLGLTLVLSTFCFNFNVTLPVLAYTTLHAHAFVFGILSAVFGAGALAGALVAASRGRASAKVMIIGSIVFTGSELLLAPMHEAVLAGILLFFTGAGFTVWSANSNTSMQLAAPDRLARGRIIGLTHAFNGTARLTAHRWLWPPAARNGVSRRRSPASQAPRRRAAITRQGALDKVAAARVPERKPA
jgi:hypothetical protein